MLLAIGVVQVLSRGKNFNGLRPASHQSIQQAGMQPFLHINERGYRFQHQ
jgi:hypothetical protein